MCTICEQNFTVGQKVRLEEGPLGAWSCCNTCNTNVTKLVFPGNYTYLGLIEGSHKFQHVQDKVCPECGEIFHIMDISHPNYLNSEGGC